MTETQRIGSPQGPVDKLLKLAFTLLKCQQQRRRQGVFCVILQKVNSLCSFLGLAHPVQEKQMPAQGLSFQVLIANE